MNRSFVATLGICACHLCASLSAAVTIVTPETAPETVSLSWPVITQPLNIFGDIAIAFPSAESAFIPNAQVKCLLHPVAANDIPEPIAIILDDSGHLPLASELLKKVYASSPVPHLTRPVEVSVFFPKGYRRTVRLILFDGSQVPQFRQNSIHVENGQPYFSHGGNILPRYTGRLSWEYKKLLGKVNRQFSRAGIHGNILACQAFEYMTVGKNGEIAFDIKGFSSELMSVFAWMAAEDPMALQTLFWSLLLPPEAGTARPEEMLKMDNAGMSVENRVAQLTKTPCLQPSYASEYWRKFAGDALRVSLEAIRNSPWADRLVNIRLCYANGGEWNHWGYHEKAMVDFSQPMQKAFGAWLQTKYHTEAALQKAWGRSDLSFASDDLVPTREQRLIGKGPFRLGGTAVQSSVDYYEFFQEYTVRTIEFFARIVKECSDWKLLAGAYYGYYWGHLTCIPLHCQDSGHYGMKYFNKSTVLDYAGGPSPYWKRNETLLLNGISFSSALHGKVWETEFDTRTHYSMGRKEFGVTSDLTETLGILQRDFFIARSGKSIAYLYDFMGDWYRSRAILNTFQWLSRLDDFLKTKPESFPRDVALVVSEETLPRLSSIREEEGALASLQHDVFFELGRTGIPFDYILESDLPAIPANRYKCYLFLNSYYVSNATLKYVKENLRKDGRSILFLYAPGVISDANVLDMERSRDLTGIGLAERQQTTADEIHWEEDNTLVINQNVKMSQRFQIADEKAVPFAFYADGTVAGATRKNADELTAVLCSPSVSHLFLRKWLQTCGIPCYQEKGSAYCVFTGPVLTLYATQAGNTEIRLPKNTEFAVDIASEMVIDPTPHKIKVNLDPKENCLRLFYVGDKDDWFRFANEMR